MLPGEAYNVSIKSDILILLVILSLIISYIGKVGENTTFQKRFIAKDMSLLIDTLYASPGNIYVEYPHTTLWFGISFKKNTLEVFEKPTESQKTKEIAHFLEDTNLRITKQVFSPLEDYKEKKSFVRKYLPVFELFKKNKYDLSEKQTLSIRFFKTQNQIKIFDKEPRLNLNEIKCNTDEKIGKISFIQTENNNRFYNSIGNLFEDLGEITKIDLPKKEKNIILILSLKENSNSNYIKSYYDANSWPLSSLSCSIVNEILSMEFGKDKDAASIPLNKLTLNKKASLDNLNQILILELSKSSTFTDDDLQQIRQAIFSAINKLK
jgi:hypothetical protein